jgi:hypothetical protein
MIAEKYLKEEKPTKRCRRCGEIKILDDYYKRENNRISSHCKLCAKAKGRKWRAEHKEHVSNHNKERYKNTKEKVLARQRRNRIANIELYRERLRTWKKEHPERHREHNRKYDKRKYSDSRKRLTRNIGVHISHILAGKKGGRGWEKLVGYTTEQLIKHIEKQFDSKMNWDNYGIYWHLDHKIPKSVFNYNSPEDIDFKKCWGLKNLQPLEKKQNITKSNKLERPFQPSLAIAC